MSKHLWQAEKQGRNLRQPQHGLRLQLLPSSKYQRLSPKPGASAREEESGRGITGRLSRPAEPSLLGLIWRFGRHALPLSACPLRGERKRGGLAGHALCLRPSLRCPLPSGYQKREGARHD